MHENTIRGSIDKMIHRLGVINGMQIKDKYTPSMYPYFTTRDLWIFVATTSVHRATSGVTIVFGAATCLLFINSADK